MRRPQFHLRTLMLVVAGVALALAAIPGAWFFLFFLSFAIPYHWMVGTRLGREIGWIIAHVCHLFGATFSFPAVDATFSRWENFPWLLISLSAIGVWLGRSLWRNRPPGAKKGHAPRREQAPDGQS